jgi:chromosome segregation protein
VHLRAIKLRGFKSFPEPVEVRLEPGVAVVVGPNGSGKSNVADALLWASGSLSPHELRAEKPDDVLFAGGGDRKAAAHCEVELVFDNEDGTWPDLEFSEVSIARRLVRGAEGQYLVNRSRAPHRPRRDPRGRRPRRGDALDRRPGQGRAGARIEA